MQTPEARARGLRNYVIKTVWYYCKDGPINQGKITELPEKTRR